MWFPHEPQNKEITHNIFNAKLGNNAYIEPQNKEITQITKNKNNTNFYEFRLKNILDNLH